MYAALRLFIAQPWLWPACCIKAGPGLYFWQNWGVFWAPPSFQLSLFSLLPFDAPTELLQHEIPLPHSSSYGGQRCFGPPKVNSSKPVTLSSSPRQGCEPHPLELRWALLAACTGSPGSKPTPSPLCPQHPALAQGIESSQS